MNTLSGKVVAIHQPNFLPWLGYFDKINRSDFFIFFDHVQRPQGKSWVSRVKVNSPYGEKWLTMPILKSGRGTEKICETVINDPKKSYGELLSKLKNYYRMAPYVRQTLEYLEKSQPKTDNLSQFNQFLIKGIAKELGMKTEFIISSSCENLLKSPLLQTEMIVETCKEFGVNNYLSGEQCKCFLDLDLFAKNNIKIEFQNFAHPIYPQVNSETFIPGLSIVDALMNCGFEGTEKLLNQIR